MVEVVKIGSSDRANLSANYLKNNTDWPDKLRNDYISIGGDGDAFYNNDALLEEAVNQNASDIAQNSTDIAQNASDISTNSSAISANSSAISQNSTDIATNASAISSNASAISANAANISTNTSAIDDINDGRYSPQFGSGSPEGVVTANRNQTYFDTSVPSMWVNSTIGASTGWVQIV